MMDIYEEHLDEAAFLWSQWERALVAPDYTLEETATLEERLLAHLDGLVVGDIPVAQELLKPALESEEPLRISSALWAMLAEPGPLELAEAMKLLEAAPLELLPSMQRALELSGRAQLAEALHPLLKAQEPLLQALTLEVLTFQGKLPPNAALERLQHPEARVAAAALRGLRPLPQEVLSRELPRLLVDARPEVRDAAMEAGLSSGSRVAWEACRKAVEARPGTRRLPLVLLALGGNDRDLERLLECARVAELQADVLWALGFSGRVQAAEVCLELMGEKPLAALAGEAFSAITGLLLEESYVVPPAEEESLPPLEEEDLDVALEPKPEDALPLPNREAVSAWWQEARKRFDRGTRYVRGRAFTIEVLLEQLEQGPMRRRHVHARELAIRSQGACTIQTQAFTQRQRAELEKARSMKARLSASSLARMFGG
jgi:uncharacterized protein (TIGR02270 family)